MAEKRFKRLVRPATAEERERHAAIREAVLQEFPPAEGAGRPESPPGQLLSPQEVLHVSPLVLPDR